MKTIAKVFSVLLAAIALMDLIQAGPDLQGPTEVVTARVMAILLPAAIAWLMWRAGSTRVTSTDSTDGTSGTP